jgi:AraC-like DNA-binding protein
VARIEEFVRANLDRQMSLRELAGLVGLSAKYFCSAFHRATGQAPHAFAQQLRIERAKALLADKSRRIVEVALDSGYASQSAFTTAFRRATGHTPADGGGSANRPISPYPLSPPLTLLLLTPSILKRRQAVLVDRRAHLCARCNPCPHSLRLCHWLETLFEGRRRAG